MKTYKEISEGKFVDTHLSNGRPNKAHPSYDTHKATYDQFAHDSKSKYAKMNLALKSTAPKPKAAAVDLDKIFYDLCGIISNFFPDGDPADYFPAYYRKTGINYEIARKAFKKNGYKDEYAYIDDMKSEHMAESVDESYNKHASAASQHDKDYARTGDPEVHQDAIKAHTRAMNTAPNDKMVQVHRNKLDDHLKLKEPKKIKESETNMKFSNYLEELSKGTLSSYVKKAKVAAVVHSIMSTSLQRSAHDHINKSYDSDDKNAHAHGERAQRAKKASEIAGKKSIKKFQGIDKAVDRLTKESIDEDRDSEFSANDHMASAPKLTVRLKNKKTNATVGKYDSHNAAKSAHAKHPDRKNIYIESVEILEDTLDEASVKLNLGYHEVHHEGKKVARYVAKYEAKEHAERLNDQSKKEKAKKTMKESEQLDESPFDWKAGKREISWDDKEKKDDGDNSGVHAARTKNRNPEGGALKKNRVGRPDGSHGKDYKIDRDKREDPNYKKELSKKVMAAKADNFKDREYFKNTMNTGIGHHQLKKAGLPATDIKHLKPMVKLPGNK